MAIRMIQGYSKERLEQSQLSTVTPLLLLGDGKLQIPRLTYTTLELASCLLSFQPTTHFQSSLIWQK